MDCGLGRCLVSLYSPQIYLDMGKLLWMCILLFRTEVITAHLTCYQFSPEHFVGNLITTKQYIVKSVCLQIHLLGTRKFVI